MKSFPHLTISLTSLEVKDGSGISNRTTILSFLFNFHVQKSRHFTFTSLKQFITSFVFVNGTICIHESLCRSFHWEPFTHRLTFEWLNLLFLVFVFAFVFVFVFVFEYFFGICNCICDALFTHQLSFERLDLLAAGPELGLPPEANSCLKQCVCCRELILNHTYSIDLNANFRMLAYIFGLDIGNLAIMRFSFGNPQMCFHFFCFCLRFRLCFVFVFVLKSLLGRAGEVWEGSLDRSGWSHSCEMM